MADIDTSRPRRRRTPAILVALTAIGAAKAGAWFYFRSKQPEADAQTRARLQPRGGRA
jgi:hypothetical protein